MKSLIQEASSISKAIEQAWDHAGKPDEFTIKILESPETNFFGLKTVKAAKIAFYFGQTGKTIHRGQIRPLKTSSARPQSPSENTPDKQPRQRQQRQQRPDARGDRRDTREPREQRNSRPSQQSRNNQQSGNESRSQQPRRQYDNASWDDQMMKTALDWVKDAIKELGRNDITVTPHLSHNYYKLRVNAPVSKDAQQSEMMLKSWGNLSMEAVREKAKQPLRNLRVIVEQSAHVRSN